jgi:DNA-binding transcriptional MerR regulator
MTRADRDPGLFTEAQLLEIERRYADGVTSRQLLGIFAEHGQGLTEATFRKYVQLGLLPRSRRVGRKGKFQGSQGIYPVGAIRRLNLVRRLMRENFTLEQILRSFRRFKDQIEELEQALLRVLSELEEEVRAQPLPDGRRRALLHDLTQTRRIARQVVRELERLEGDLARAPGHDSQETAPRAGLLERRS